MYFLINFKIVWNVEMLKSFKYVFFLGKPWKLKEIWQFVKCHSTQRGYLALSYSPPGLTVDLCSSCLLTAHDTADCLVCSFSYSPPVLSRASPVSYITTTTHTWLGIQMALFLLKWHYMYLVVTCVTLSETVPLVPRATHRQRADEARGVLAGSRHYNVCRHYSH